MVQVDHCLRWRFGNRAYVIEEYTMFFSKKPFMV